MYRSARQRAMIAVALSLLFAAGCVTVADLSPAQIVSGLSELILEPEDTCAELRDRYHLGYLSLVDYPTEAGMSYEEHWVPVDGEITLRTWYLPAKLNRGTVVFSHGNAGTLPCYLFTADLLTSYGWSVVMYDYEGYGLSGGRPSLDVLDRDLETIVEWTRAYTGRSQVTLFGLSLGSIPTVSVAVERPDAVNAVILDSPVALGAEIARFGFILFGWADWIINQLDPDLLPDATIVYLQQPLLIFLHERDYVTPPRTVELLYERAAGPKELVRFGDLGHARGQFFSTDVYLYHLERFLTDVWAPTSTDGSSGRTE